MKQLQAGATDPTKGSHSEGEDGQAYPSQRMAWTALILLMLGVFISCLDRGIVHLLVEPIKAEYRLTDTQFGALQSLAFGMFYITMAIPLGALADRYQRRIVIAIGIAIFNAFAIMTGLARNYTQLFIARAGVGFGEASLAPAAFSMIGDYFPRDKMGRAMSLFTISNYVGSAMALIIGGALIGWYDQVYAAQPDALFGFKPWQATVISIAIPGLLLFPCFLLLREPPRRRLAGEKSQLSFRETMRELGRRRSALLLLVGGAALSGIMTQAVSMWLPALFIRVYGWGPAQVGLWLGILLLGGGIAGAYSGGWLTDRMTARGKPGVPITIVAWSFVGVGIFGTIAPLMPTPELSLLCFVPVFLLKPIVNGVVPPALQLIMPNRLRAKVGAIYLTSVGLVGLAIGPIVVGILTDYVFGTPTGVRYSMAVLTAVTAPLVVLLMVLARRPYLALREAGE